MLAFLQKYYITVVTLKIQLLKIINKKNFEYLAQIYIKYRTYLTFNRFFQGVNSKSYLKCFSVMPLSSGDSFELNLFMNYSIIVLYIIIPILVVFTCVTLYLIKQTLKDFSAIVYFLIPLLSVSLIFYVSPTIMLIFSIFASGFVLNLTYSEFFSKWISSKLSSSNLIAYLEEIGLLRFFFRLFSFVFNSSSSIQFVLILVCSHTLSLFYVVFSRYFIFFTFVNPVIFPWSLKIMLYIIIFICLVSILVRFLINTSMIIVGIVNKNMPQLWEDFLITEPMMNPQENPPLNSNSNNGWFSKYNNNNNYYSSGGIPPRTNFWKAAGFGIGLCTLGVGCFVAYHTYGAHIEAQKQTLEAYEANRLKRYELAKQNPRDIDNIFIGYPEEKDFFQKGRRK